jgi:hypothetical protein
MDDYAVQMRLANEEAVRQGLPWISRGPGISFYEVKPGESKQEAIARNIRETQDAVYQHYGYTRPPKTEKNITEKDAFLILQEIHRRIEMIKTSRRIPIHRRIEMVKTSRRTPRVIIIIP